MTHHSPESIPPHTPEAEPVPLTQMPEIGRVRLPEEEAAIADQFHGAIQELSSNTISTQRFDANYEKQAATIERLYGHDKSSDDYREAMEELKETFDPRKSHASKEQQSAKTTLSELFKAHPDIAPAWMNPVTNRSDRHVQGAQQGTDSTKRALDSAVNRDPSSETKALVRENVKLRHRLFGRYAVTQAEVTTPGGQQHSRNALRNLREHHENNPIADVAGPAPKHTDYDLSTRKGAKAFAEATVAHRAQVTRVENAHKERERQTRAHEAALARSTLEVRKATVLRERAMQGLNIQNAIAGKLSEVKTIADEVLEERRQAIEQANVALTEVHSHLNLWNMGEAAPSNDYAAQAGELLNYIAGQLDNLAPTDPERHALMAQWVKQTVRLQNRRIIADDPGDTSIPTFTPDRGVRMQTDDGERVFYDDGTIGITDAAGDIRRVTTSGQEYTPDPFPVAPELLPELDAIPLADEDEPDLSNIYDKAFAEWEQTRLPAAEQVAEHVAKHYADRLAQRDEQYVEAITSIHHDLETHEERLDNMKAGFDAALAWAIKQGEGVMAATVRLKTSIAEQQELVDTTQEKMQNIRDEMKQHRAHMNRVRYEQGFLNASAPLSGTDSDVIVHEKGAVGFNKTTINGITGAWNILPNGKSILVNPDGTTQVFNEYGEEL